MAIGDLAAAAGLVTYPATQDLRTGYQNDNQRGDDIAVEMAARAAADAQKLDASKVLVQSTAMTSANAVGTLRFW